jgi:hypothetical protein
MLFFTAAAPRKEYAAPKHRLLMPSHCPYASQGFVLVLIRCLPASERRTHQRPRRAGLVAVYLPVGAADLGDDRARQALEEFSERTGAERAPAMTFSTNRCAFTLCQSLRRTLATSLVTT